MWVSRIHLDDHFPQRNGALRTLDRKKLAEPKLTVLQVLPALDGGGVERGTLEVARYLVECGHRSLVMSGGGRVVKQLRAESSEHVAWPIGGKSPWTLRWVPRLRRFLTEQRVDILHARSRIPAWVAYLAWRGMDPARRPHFVTTVHGLYSKPWYSHVMARGEIVIAVSNTIRAYIQRTYPWVSTDHIRLIYRGIYPAAFPYDYQPPKAWLRCWRESFPRLAGKRLITLSARITRLKGQEQFIELMAALKRLHGDVHGLLVGDTHPRHRGFRAELEKQIAAAGLAFDITFTGHRDDLREIMAVSDIVLSLSKEPESFGRTTLEALSLGKPVVGYDHGGVGEVLSAMFSEGRVPPGELSVLTSKVSGLLSRPHQPAPSNPFLLSSMVEKTLAIYMELVSSPRAMRE